MQGLCLQSSHLTFRQYMCVKSFCKKNKKFKTALMTSFTLLLPPNHKRNKLQLIWIIFVIFVGSSFSDLFLLTLLKALLSLNYVLQGRNFYAILHGSFSMLVNLMILKNADPLLFGRQNPFLYKFFDVIR